MWNLNLKKKIRNRTLIKYISIKINDIRINVNEIRIINIKRILYIHTDIIDLEIK